MVKSFEDLDCWKKATELRRQISVLVKTFPGDEKYKLTDQITRASRSVTANIAEGYGRYHYQEFIQFCRQSRGSLYEVIDHLIVAKDEGYVSGIEYNDLRIKANEALALLNGFINYLSKAKAKVNRVEEPELDYDQFVISELPLTIND